MSDNRANKDNQVTMKFTTEISDNNSNRCADS